MHWRKNFGESSEKDIGKGKHWWNMYWYCHEIITERSTFSKQKGGSDCGVFAIALWINPSKLKLKQEDMRVHLALAFCLNEEHFTVFPFYKLLVCCYCCSQWLFNGCWFFYKELIFLLCNHNSLCIVLLLCPKFREFVKYRIWNCGITCHN